MTLVQLGPLKFDPTAGPPCHDCPAKCCKYFALQIDKPTTPREHDNIRWYLMHEHIAVWVQDGDWHLEVRTSCQHLQADNRCGIYHSRPSICREYGWPDADNPDDPCEYFTGNDGYDLLFETAESFSAWSKVELARREERLAKRRKSKGTKQAIA